MYTPLDNKKGKIYLWLIIFHHTTCADSSRQDRQGVSDSLVSLSSSSITPLGQLFPLSHLTLPLTLSHLNTLDNCSHIFLILLLCWSGHRFIEIIETSVISIVMVSMVVKQLVTICVYGR